MRKIVSSVLCIFASVAFVFMQGATAHAADYVYSNRCYDSDSSLYRICVDVRFDNTNCDEYSLDNCSGLNGAKVYYIEITTFLGTIATTNVPFSLDVYGDATSEYTAAYLTNFQDWGNHKWRAYLPETFRGDTNRVCVKVRSSAAASSSGVKISGMNPYGLSMSGACNL